jgi:fibrillarin-like pre-rRNA processing protein
LARESSAAREVFPGVFSVPDPKNPNKRLVATKNLTPGRVYYGERLVQLPLVDKTGNAEFRLWDPFRSKLSAAILNGLKQLPIREGITCLYLGASTGTTVSHLSDIVGERGRIFAVEMASRVARELLEKVVQYRRNIVPIIADARHPEQYPSIYGDVRVVYCDIAQPDQTDIAINNCERFLDSSNGRLFLVVKASSIDALKEKAMVFDEQTRILKRANFELLQKIDLEPYDRNHAILVSERKRNQ